MTAAASDTPDGPPSRRLGSGDCPGQAAHATGGPPHRDSPASRPECCLAARSDGYSATHPHEIEEPAVFDHTSIALAGTAVRRIHRSAATRIASRVRAGVPSAGLRPAAPAAPQLSGSSRCSAELGREPPARARRRAVRGRTARCTARPTRARGDARSRRGRAPRSGTPRTVAAAPLPVRSAGSRNAAICRGCSAASGSKPASVSTADPRRSTSRHSSPRPCARTNSIAAGTAR